MNGLYGSERFPRNKDRLVEEGLRYWFGEDNKITFVNNPDDADLLIGAYSKNGIRADGFAEFPTNDDFISEASKPTFLVYEPLIRSATSSASRLTEVVAHEFGHTLGIKHTLDIAPQCKDSVMRGDGYIPNEICDSKVDAPLGELLSPGFRHRHICDPVAAYYIAEARKWEENRKRERSEGFVPNSTPSVPQSRFRKTP